MMNRGPGKSERFEEHDYQPATDKMPEVNEARLRELVEKLKESIRYARVENRKLGLSWQLLASVPYLTTRDANFLFLTHYFLQNPGLMNDLLASTTINLTPTLHKIRLHIKKYRGMNQEELLAQVQSSLDETNKENK